MKHWKRVLAFVLTLGMILSLLPAAAAVEGRGEVRAAPAEADPASAGTERGGGGSGTAWLCTFEKENSLLGWQTIDANWDGLSFGRVEDAATGDWCVISNAPCREYPGSQHDPDDYLITPRIELPYTDCEYTLGVDGAVLQGGRNVAYDIYVYTGEELLRPENLDSLLGHPYRFGVFSWSEWSWEYMDLTAYAGQTIQIVIRAHSIGNNGTNALKIREISVSFGSVDETLAHVTAMNVPLPKLDVNVDTLKESSITFPDNANCELVPGSLTYFKTVDEQLVTMHNEVFREGVEYSLRFRVRPKAGVEIYGTPYASVNGKWAQAMCLQNQNEIQIDYFNLPPVAPTKEVSEINLRIAPPIPGTMPNPTAERWLAKGSTDFHYTVSDVKWVNAETDNYIDMDQAFEPGIAYGTYIELALESGYAFSENPHFTVNGVPVMSFIIYPERTSAILINNFEADCRQPIDAVDLYFFPPVHGEPLNYEFQCAQGSCFTVEHSWYSLFFLGGMPDDAMYRETFERGIWYRLRVCLKPYAADQQLDPATRVRINGIEAVLDQIEADRAWYTADFKCADPWWRGDFEGPWGFDDWKAIDANGDGNTFRRVEFTNQYNQTNCVASLDQPIDETGTHGCDDYLVSPWITLPAGGELEMAVDQGGSTGEVWIYNGTEELRADNVDRLLKNKIYSYGSLSDEIVMLWDQEYDLKYFEGQTVQIVFRLASAKGGSMILDNLRILHIPDGTFPVIFNVTAMNAPTPKPGQTVAEVSDFTAAVPADAHYRVEPGSVKWYRETSIAYKAMAPDETFEAGAPYHLEFRVLAEDGYAFFDGYWDDIDGAASIDGRSVRRTVSYDDKTSAKLWMSFDRLEDPVSDTVTVTFNAHGHGETPDPIEVPAGTKWWEVLNEHPELVNQKEDGLCLWNWSQVVTDRWADALSYSYQFTEDSTLYAVWLEQVSDLELWVDQPFVGRTIDKPRACVEKYSFHLVTSLGWYNALEDVNSANYATGSFEAGHTYYGALVIGPGDQTMFTEAGSIVTVHGATKVLEQREDNGLFIVFSLTLPPSSSSTDTVDLWMDTPVPGSSIDMAPGVYCLSPGITVTQDAWWNKLEDVENYDLCNTRGFGPGNTYYNAVNVRTESMHPFNGTPQIHCGGSAEVVRITPVQGNYIQRVVLRMTVPECYGMLVQTEGRGWFFLDDNPHAKPLLEGAFFEAGTHTLTAKAEPGWRFEGWYDENGDLLSDEEVFTFNLNHEIEGWKAVFVEGQPIDLVEFQAVIPKAGDSFNWETQTAGVVVCNGAPVKIVQDAWYNEWGLSGAPLPFEEGQNYFLGIEVQAEAGYEITEDTVFRINGEDVVWASKTNVITWSISSRNYAMQSAQKIETMELHLHHVPAAGETFDPSYDGVYLSTMAQIEWVDTLWRKADGTTSYPLSFVRNGQYYAYCEITGQPGWRLAKDTVVTIDGEAAESWIELGAGRFAFTTKAYTVLDEQVIPYVEVFANKPICDFSLSDPYVPTYMPYVVEDWTWTDAKGSVLPKDAMVEEAGEYTLTVYVKPLEGYMFSADEISAQMFWDLTQIVSVQPHRLTLRGTCTAVQLNPFVDVKRKDYFYDAVLWAYLRDPQVTAGTDATHFSPKNDCTRGQVVTFLWRAAGCPEPTQTSHPFTDVKSTAFYYKAMLWAVETGITTGTSATTFGPNKACTRGQVVTFLWRAQGSPEPRSTTCPFTDVKKSASYYKAVLWAVEEGVTTGTSSTTFSPSKTCNRGQVVTFLYRVYGPKG